MTGLFTETVDGSTHLVTTVLPPQNIDPTITTSPRDIVLILDKSGSMDGTAITQAKQAIRLAIARLPKDARFNLIAFDNVASSVFNGLQPANEKFITTAGQRCARRSILRWVARASPGA
jgi:Ca-activated chloride channel family protein